VDEGLKKRLIGATVLVSLVVIFVPMLLEKDPVVSTDLEENIIPEKPETDFSSRVMPLEDEDLSRPPPAVVEPVTPVIQPSPDTQAPKQVVASKKPQKKAVPKPVPQKRAPPQRVGLTAWVIQVGSFSNEAMPINC